MKLTEKYQVGQTVKDSQFSGLTGVITKVTTRSVTVKHKHSTGKYTGDVQLEVITL